jgi:hypothetical protein
MSAVRVVVVVVMRRQQRAQVPRSAFLSLALHWAPHSRVRQYYLAVPLITALLRLPPWQWALFPLRATFLGLGLSYSSLPATVRAVAVVLVAVVLRELECGCSTLLM